MHSQTTLVQGQRRESSPALPESSVSVKRKKGCLQTDLLSSSSRAPQTGGILMMCFISKSSCYPTKEKPRVCTGLICCSLGGTIFLACARIARWIDWPRSQCPPPLPCLHVETPSLGKCCTVLLYVLYCTVVPYCTVHTSRNW